MVLQTRMLISILVAITIYEVSSQGTPSCDSHIYCQGQLLDVVQSAKLFNDSKTFVDHKMLFDEETVLDNFNKMMNSTNNAPDKESVRKFVESNFADGDELEEWTLPDFNENPPFLQKINNETLKKFASDLVQIWPTLAKKIKPDVVQNIDRYSIIPIPNGFVVPGGRFKETYYWDTYWIIKGLLISGMPESAKSILGNFLYLVDKFGFIPNGARIYYLNRSQPPFLTPMVRLYIDATNDLDWLKENIHLLEKELQFFIVNRAIRVHVNDRRYTLAHYYSSSGSPRPESYVQDVETCAPWKDQSRIEQCYVDLKTAAESGWDFSYRWVFDDYGGNNANRSSIETRRVIPVDLNSVLAKAFRDISFFYDKLGDSDKSNYWILQHQQWKEAIDAVFYNKDQGIWFDFDLELRKQRELFYPSNIAPLWADLYSPEDASILGEKAHDYLLNNGILVFFGGTPASLNSTGEQWDYPAAWAPLQSFLVQGLQNSGNPKAQQLAATLADRWVQANLIGFETTGLMYEKYNCEEPGENGSGGEYTVQAGFGMTNGVALETIVEFFSSP